MNQRAGDSLKAETLSQGTKTTPTSTGPTPLKMSKGAGSSLEPKPQSKKSHSQSFPHHSDMVAPNQKTSVQYDPKQPNELETLAMGTNVESTALVASESCVPEMASETDQIENGVTSGKVNGLLSSSVVSNVGVGDASLSGQFVAADALLSKQQEDQKENETAGIVVKHDDLPKAGIGSNNVSSELIASGSRVAGTASNGDTGDTTTRAMMDTKSVSNISVAGASVSWPCHAVDVSLNGMDQMVGRDQMPSKDNNFKKTMMHNIVENKDQPRLALSTEGASLLMSRTSATASPVPAASDNEIDESKDFTAQDGSSATNSAVSVAEQVLSANRIGNEAPNAPRAISMNGVLRPVRSITSEDHEHISSEYQKLTACIAYSNFGCSSDVFEWLQSVITHSERKTISKSNEYYQNYNYVPQFLEFFGFVDDPNSDCIRCGELNEIIVNAGEIWLESELAQYHVSEQAKFYYALVSTKLDWIEECLKNGSDANIKFDEFDDQSTLVVAVHFGSFEMMELLISFGLDLDNCVGADKNVLLERALRHHNGLFFVKFMHFLEKNGLKMNLTKGDENGRTPLHDAVEESDLARARYLLKQVYFPKNELKNSVGISVLRAKNCHDMTALEEACRNNTDVGLDIFQLLIEYPSDTSNVVDWVCKYGNGKILAFLIDEKLVSIQSVKHAVERNGLANSTGKNSGGTLFLTTYLTQYMQQTQNKVTRKYNIKQLHAAI